MQDLALYFSQNQKYFVPVNFDGEDGPIDEALKYHDFLFENRESRYVNPMGKVVLMNDLHRIIGEEGYTSTVQFIHLTATTGLVNNAAGVVAHLSALARDMAGVA